MVPPKKERSSRERWSSGIFPDWWRRGKREMQKFLRERGREMLWREDAARTISFSRTHFAAGSNGIGSKYFVTMTFVLRAAAFIPRTKDFSAASGASV